MHTLPPPLLAALPAPYQLRLQHDGDDAFAAALYSATRDDLRQMQAEPALIEELIAMQRRMQSHGYRQHFPQAAYLVLLYGDIPIGRLVIEQREQALRVVDIAVLPEARGRGAGSAVLRCLQSLAEAQQLQIHLGVNRNNLAARKLYLRLGFQVQAEDQVQEQLVWRAARCH